MCFIYHNNKESQKYYKKTCFEQQKFLQIWVIYPNLEQFFDDGIVTQIWSNSPGIGIIKPNLEFFRIFPGFFSDASPE